MARGEAPQAAGDPEGYRIRPVDMLLKRELPWVEPAKAAMRLLGEGMVVCGHPTPRQRGTAPRALPGRNSSPRPTPVDADRPVSYAPVRRR